MSGTIRTLKNTTREMVKTRMDAIVSTVAAAFNAEAHVEYGSGCPVLFHNQELYGEMCIRDRIRPILFQKLPLHQKEIL